MTVQKKLFKIQVTSVLLELNGPELQISKWFWTVLMNVPSTLFYIEINGIRVAK